MLYDPRLSMLHPVMLNRGGASGAGTVLTEKGKRLMDAYDQFAAQMKKEVDPLYSGFFSDSMNSTCRCAASSGAVFYTILRRIS